MRPYNWGEIIQRSKLLKEQCTKEQTFISHLNQFQWSTDKIGYNVDGSKIKTPKGQVKLPIKKKLSKVDEKRENLLEIADFLIKYMIELRKYPFVCQTQKRNVLGINVIQQFYVDDQGNTFSDTD